MMGKGTSGGRATKVDVRLSGRTAQVKPTRDVPEYATLKYLGQKSFQFKQWYITPGWEKRVERVIAEATATKFPDHFRVAKDE